MKGDAHIRVKADEVAIVGRTHETGEDGHTLWILAFRHPPKQLVDYKVEPVVVVYKASRKAGDSYEIAAGDQKRWFSNLPKSFQPPSLIVPARAC